MAEDSIDTTHVLLDSLGRSQDLRISQAALPKFDRRGDHPYLRSQRYDFPTRISRLCVENVQDDLLQSLPEFGSRLFLHSECRENRANPQNRYRAWHRL